MLEIPGKWLKKGITHALKIFFVTYFVVLLESIYPHHLMPHTILLEHSTRLLNTFARVEKTFQIQENARKRRLQVIRGQGRFRHQPQRKRRNDMFHWRFQKLLKVEAELKKVSFGLNKQSDPGKTCSYFRCRYLSKVNNTDNNQGRNRHNFC